VETQTRNALKVGILILIFLIILVVTVFSITDRRLGRRGYQFTVAFPTAQGLGKGAAVQYAGVAVGEVKAVQLVTPEGSAVPEVRLTVWLPHDVRLHEDTVAKISTFGLLGEKYLELTPIAGQGEFIKTGTHVQGVATASPEDILQQSSFALTQFNKILERLAKGEGTLGKLISTDELHRALIELVEEIKRNPWRLFRKPKR